MRTIEIPRQAWADRLNQFTAIHEGWLVSLDILGAVGIQTQVTNLPLLGVSADRVDHDGTITVSVARSANEHLTHMIEGLRRLSIQTANDGAEAALQMESADGTKSTLRFRVAARPETVDGIAAPRCASKAAAVSRSAWNSPVSPSTAGAPAIEYSDRRAPRRNRRCF